MTKLKYDPKRLGQALVHRDLAGLSIRQLQAIAQYVGIWDHQYQQNRETLETLIEIKRGT